MEQVLDILRGEFATYYTLSDLPKTWDESTIKVELPRMAMNTAERLKRRAGVNNLLISDLTQTLDFLQAQQLYNFAETITGFDTPNWQTQENFPILQLVVHNIAEILKA